MQSNRMLQATQKSCCGISFARDNSGLTECLRHITAILLNPELQKHQIFTQVRIIQCKLAVHLVVHPLEYRSTQIKSEDTSLRQQAYLNCIAASTLIFCKEIENSPPPSTYTHISFQFSKSLKVG